MLFQPYYEDNSPDNRQQVYTYGQLNEQANQLANYLYGILESEKEMIVGIYLERSPFTIIAMLAVMKVGMYIYIRFLPIQSYILISYLLFFTIICGNRWMLYPY